MSTKKRKKYLKNLKKVESLVFCFIYKNFLFFSSASVNYFMSEELSKEQAERIVRKFCKPPYDPDEAKLKEAAWKVLKECKCGVFEWDRGDEEEEKPKIKKNKKIDTKQGLSSAQDAAKESGGVIEAVKEYGLEIAQNVQSLGAAGSVAFSSATYFQSTEAIETTQEIAAVVETVEHNYGQTLNSYIFEQTAIFVEKIPYVNETKIAQNVAEKLAEVAENAETPEERKERREAEAAEKEAAESEAEEATETEAATETESQAETETQTEGDAESESNDEQSAEEAEDSSQEASEESESEQSESTEASEEASQEASQEEAQTEPEAATETEQSESEPTPPEVAETDGIDAQDPIKPHSMVGDDAFDPVFTPDDAKPTSPSNQQP